MQWKHVSSPPFKMFKAMATAGRSLLTFFFNNQYPLFVEFLEHRRTITSDTYYETLRSARRSIKNKRKGLLKEGLVLLHDNSRPLVSRITTVKIDKFRSEQLVYPFYSLHMSPCDFHLLIC